MEITLYDKIEKLVEKKINQGVLSFFFNNFVTVKFFFRVHAKTICTCLKVYLSNLNSF
jgi:hypothetical protein